MSEIKKTANDRLLVSHNQFYHRPDSRMIGWHIGDVSKLYQLPDAFMIGCNTVDT